MTKNNKKLTKIELIIIFFIILIIFSTIVKIVSNNPFLVINKENLIYSEYKGYVSLVESKNYNSKSSARIEFRYDNNQQTANIVCLSNPNSSSVSYTNCPIVNKLRELKEKDPKKFWYPIKVESSLLKFPIIDFIIPSIFLTKKAELI